QRVTHSCQLEDEQLKVLRGRLLIHFRILREASRDRTSGRTRGRKCKEKAAVSRRCPPGGQSAVSTRRSVGGVHPALEQSSALRACGTRGGRTPPPSASFMRNSRRANISFCFHSCETRGGRTSPSASIPAKLAAGEHLLLLPSCGTRGGRTAASGFLVGDARGGSGAIRGSGGARLGGGRGVGGVRAGAQAAKRGDA